MPEHNRFSKGIFSWVCPKIECIEYEVKERASGVTKWSFVKLFKYAMEGIMSFSHMPLLIPFMLGAVELFSAMVILLAILIGAIADASFAFGTLWIVFGLLMLTGFQSLSTGIIGQYLAKVHTETTNRPIYVVKEVLK